MFVEGQSWVAAEGPLGARAAVDGPGTPALDPGLVAVRLAYDALGVEPAWSVIEPRGFTWWAGSLAQRIWSEPGIKDLGMRAYRLHAETVVVRDVPDPAAAAPLINDLNLLCTLSGRAIDPVARTIVHRAGAWVHDGTVSLVPRLFAAATALQVVEAHAEAGLLAQGSGGALARDAHPTNGRRTTPSELLAVDAIPAIHGTAPSRWADGSIPESIGTLERARIIPHATTTPEEVSLVLPFGPYTALFQASTRRPHPLLGNGLEVRLTLPAGVSGIADAAFALDVAQQEHDPGIGARLARAHRMGAWVADQGVIRHLAFYPNHARVGGEDTLNLLLTGILRARWAAWALT